MSYLTMCRQSLSGNNDVHLQMWTNRIFLFQMFLSFSKNIQFFSLKKYWYFSKYLENEKRFEAQIFWNACEKNLLFVSKVFVWSFWDLDIFSIKKKSKFDLKVDIKLATFSWWCFRSLVANVTSSVRQVVIVTIPGSQAGCQKMQAYCKHQKKCIGVSRRIARNITCFLFNGKEKLHFGQYLSWNLHVYCIYATSCVFNLMNFTVVPKMNREL